MNRFRDVQVAIVDDDESLCRSLGRLLQAAGMEAVTYRSAESFLADTNRSRFDCLVLDIRLGGMSGIELNRQLATLGWTTPVIFNTAHDEPEIREQALRTGCIAYLRKTEAGQAILSAISRAIRRGTVSDGE